MRYDWDEGKRAVNIIKHGLDFTVAEGFQWDGAMIKPDTRRHYGEHRFIATGFIEDRLHVIVFTLRSDMVRIIGLRKANPREVKQYEDQKA